MTKKLAIEKHRIKTDTIKGEDGGGEDDSGLKASIVWIKQQKLLSVCFWVIMALATICTCLTVAIIVMLPLKETETMFVHIKGSEENFVILEKANATLQSNAPLISDYMRIYVTHREMVDKVTEQIRYRRVKAMSTKEVGDIFQNFVTDKKRSPYLKDNLIRKIDISTDLPLAQGIHQVWFERTDFYDDKPNAEPKITRWVATIHYRFVDQKTSYANKHLNPLGMFVDQYNITQARNRGDTE